MKGETREGEGKGNEYVVSGELRDGGRRASWAITRAMNAFFFACKFGGLVEYRVWETCVIRVEKEQRILTRFPRRIWTWRIMKKGVMRMITSVRMWRAEIG